VTAAFLLLGALLAATPPQTGDGPVDALVADLAAGRREAALARIYEMNSLSGQPNAVALASEFVDKLSRCTLLSFETRNLGGVMYDLRWRCPDGDYYSLLDSAWRPPRIVVGEFLSAEAREARRRTPMAPPMPYVPNVPPPSDDEKVRMVSDYLDGIQPGGHALRAFISFRLEFVDRRQPAAFIGPDQLGRYLSSCHREGTPRVAESGPDSGRVVIRWTCTGAGALDREITTVMSPYQGRIVGGLVMVGPAPDAVP